METIQVFIVIAVFFVVGLLGVYLGSRKPDTGKQASDLWKAQNRSKRLEWKKEND